MLPTDFIAKYHLYRSYSEDIAKAECEEVNKKLAYGKAVVTKSAIDSYCLMLKDHEKYIPSEEPQDEQENTEKCLDH